MELAKEKSSALCMQEQTSLIDCRTSPNSSCSSCNTPSGRSPAACVLDGCRNVLSRCHMLDRCPDMLLSWQSSSPCVHTSRAFGKSGMLNPNPASRVPLAININHSVWMLGTARQLSDKLSCDNSANKLSPHRRTSMPTTVLYHSSAGVGSCKLRLATLMQVDSKEHSCLNSRNRCSTSCATACAATGASGPWTAALHNAAQIWCIVCRCNLDVLLMLQLET